MLERPGAYSPIGFTYWGNPGLSPHKQGGDVTMSSLKYEAFDATNTSMNFPTVSLKSRL